MSPHQKDPGRRLLASTDDATYQRTLDHAKVGYANAQDIIKFVDSKCSVLIALSTSVAGFSVALVRWNLENPLGAGGAAFGQGCNCWLCGALLLFFSSLVACVICIGATIWTLIARPAPSGSVSVLFPVSRNVDKLTHNARIAEALMGMDKAAILQEYQEQLIAVGRILQSKLNHSRVAAIALMTQLGFITLAAMIYFTAVASNL